MTREQADWLRRRIRADRNFYFRLRDRLGKWFIRDGPTYKAHVQAARVYDELIKFGWALTLAGEIAEQEADPELWCGDGI